MENLEAYKELIDRLTDTESYKFYLQESGFPTEEQLPHATKAQKQLYQSGNKLLSKLSSSEKVVLGDLAEYFVRQGVTKCLQEIGFDFTLYQEDKPLPKKPFGKRIEQDYQKRCEVNGQPFTDWANSHPEGPKAI
jgi:hypothetical protein